MHLVPIPAENVAQVWPLVADQVAAACAKSVWHYSTQELLQRCSEGTAYLLIGVNDDRERVMCGIAEFSLGADRAIVCNIFAAAGRAPQTWGPLFAQFEAWARHCGARRITLQGRPGLAPILRRYGLRTRQVTMSKEL